MGDKETVFEQSIKYKGFFKYSELYEYFYGLLKGMGMSVSEDEYVEKIGGGGKDIEVSWKASKSVSDYFKNHMSVKISVSGLSDAEVNVNGKNEKTNSGSLKVKVSAELERDYESEWEKKPSLKIWRGIYDKYIIRTTNEEYAGKLAGKAAGFVAEVKAYLNLEGKA